MLLPPKFRIILFLMDHESDFVYSSMIARGIGMITQTYIFPYIANLRDTGLLNVEKIGRTNKVTLTEKGKDIAHHIKAVKEVFYNENDS